jgi:hypothetical protein
MVDRRLLDELDLPDNRTCPCGKAFSVKAEAKKLSESTGNVTTVAFMLVMADDPRADANGSMPPMVIACCSPMCLPLGLRKLAELTEESLRNVAADMVRDPGKVH